MCSGCVYEFLILWVLFFVFSVFSVVCMCFFIFIRVRDDVRLSLPTPFDFYPKAVLQVHETSESARKSLGRLWDVSEEHLSLLTNPPTKPKETPMNPCEAFIGAEAGPSLAPTTDSGLAGFSSFSC